MYVCVYGIYHFNFGFYLLNALDSFLQNLIEQNGKILHFTDIQL